MSKEKAKPEVARNTAPERSAWRRDEIDQKITERLGQRVREYREKHNITMAEASEMTGVPGATLSRIENNKMSPTFPVLMKILMGLRMPLSGVLRESNGVENEVASILTKPEDETSTTSTPGYDYTPLHSASPHIQNLQPLIIDVKARSLEEAGGLRAHEGLELAYVVHGTLEFHIEGEPPRIIKQGGSALFRCERPHAYVSVGKSRTQILCVIMSDQVGSDARLEDRLDLRKV